MVTNDFRRIVPEESEEFRDFIQYSFFPKKGSAVPDQTPVANMYRNGYDAYGYFEDDDLRFGILGTELDATVRGGDTRASIMQYATTPPEHRRTGVFKRALEEVFESLSQRGVPFLIGRAFKDGVWDRLGFGRICNWTRWRFRTDVLLTAVDEPRGRFRRFDLSDWRDLDAVYEQYTDRYTVSFDRTEEYWRTVVAPFGKPEHIAGWTVDGELRGYVVYKFAPGELTTLQEVDMAYVDQEAQRHLLYFMGNNDSQADVGLVFGPEGESKFDLVDEPDTVEAQVHGGPILRITDVERALTVPSYPSDVTASLTIAVDDSMIPDNDGRFELTVREGTASCIPTDDEPDVEADAESLARLLVGYRDISTLEGLTDITVNDEATRETVGRLFPERPSFIRDEV